MFNTCRPGRLPGISDLFQEQEPGCLRESSLKAGIFQEAADQSLKSENWNVEAKRVLLQVDQFELAATMTIPNQANKISFWTGLSLNSSVEDDPVSLLTSAGVVGDHSGHGKLLV